MTAGDRVIAMLLRLYPRSVRERFGRGMQDALVRDLLLARSRGKAAVIAFWLVTGLDACRFALAERRKALNLRALWTVDWRDARRSLRSAPMVTGFCVVSLACGIGGVTALFSILNALLLKPLPVREPQQLVLLDQGSFTNPIWEAIRDRQSAIAAGACAWGTPQFNLAPSGAADMVAGLWVSGSFFDVLGVPMAAGRSIAPADDVRGGGPSRLVAVVSHRFAQLRFGSAEAAIGKQIQIERVPFSIIGVTAPRFRGPDVGRVYDVAVPLATEPMIRPRDSALDSRSSWWLSVMARLRKGQTAEQASALLQAFQPQIREATMPRFRSADARANFLSEPLRFVAAPGGSSGLRGRYQQPLTTVLGVAAVVLLIACANVANLLIARASSRRRDLTLRLALGASRIRLAKQLAAESLLLAAGGAVAGAALAGLGSRALVSQLTTVQRAIDLDLTLDWRVLAFTLAVTAAAALASSIAPALSVNALTPGETLKQGRSATRWRMIGARQATVILQVALSLTLVVAAGLFAGSFSRLMMRDIGFDPRGVLLVTARVDRNPVSGEARAELFDRFARAAASVPGVAAAAVSFTTPGGDAAWNTRIDMPPDSPLPPRQRSAWVNAVSPGWFQTMGLRLAAGRDFSAADRKGAPLVAIVNRSFARRYLAGRSAVGSTFATVEPSGPPMRYEVVGVVEDALYRTLRSPMDPTMYVPMGQDEPDTTTMIAIRTASASPRLLARTVADAIAREDPTAVLGFRTLEEQLGATVAQDRLVALLAGSFGLIGLLLAALGLYGITAYAVSARRAEIGIRMALGASAHGVVRMLMAQVARLVASGLAIGAALSLWAVTFVRTLLYGLEARDPWTFAAAAAILTTVAAFAAWIPARRASRVDPVAVLRTA